KSNVCEGSGGQRRVRRTGVQNDASISGNVSTHDAGGDRPAARVSRRIINEPVNSARSCGAGALPRYPSIWVRKWSRVEGFKVNIIAACRCRTYQQKPCE